VAGALDAFDAWSKPMPDSRPVVNAANMAGIAKVALALVVLQAGTAVQAQQALLGVYYGNQGWAMNQVKAMETWQGKRHAVVNLFTDWCSRTKTLDNLFKQQLPAIWANGNVPVITWEPFLCSPASTPGYMLVRASRGDYDAYLNAWSERLKAFISGPDGSLGTADDRRVYIRLAHEMNGNWYPWSAGSGGNTPGHYIETWRRARAIFAIKGLDARSVQWIWAVNHEDVGSARAEDCYPGDAEVDWIGIDGYNWGASQSWSTWRTPQAVFGAMVTRLRGFSARPLALTETASTSATTGGVDLSAKSLWISQFFDYALANNARMLVWFNEDKEADWAIFGGSNGTETYRSGRTSYKAFTSYREAARSNALLASNPGDPRLLSETLFRGGW
jgi:mannan endo-1,4-beta-mannosidase